MINKYLKSLPKKRKIEIFYDARFGNPFKIKFPFISCFEDLEKRDEYLKEINFLVDDGVYRGKYCACEHCDCYCDKNCIDCDCDCYVIINRVYLRDEENYKGESIICKYHKLIDLLNRRILIEYFIRNRNNFQFYNTEKNHRRYCIRNNDMMKRVLDSSDSD